MNQRSKKDPNRSYTLSYEELVTTILQREKETKTLLEYAIETKTIRPEALLNILNHQNEHHKTFYESFRAILGDNFTDKYLKLYAVQIPTIVSVYEDHENMIQKTGNHDLKSNKTPIITVELKANSRLELISRAPDENLNPLVGNIKSEQALTAINSHSINQDSVSKLKSMSEVVPLPPNSVNLGSEDQYSIDDDDNEDDDDFVIETYEAPEMAGHSRPAPANLRIVQAQQESEPLLSSSDNEEVHERDTNEAAELKQLSVADQAASGFILPSISNETLDLSLLSDFLEFFDDYQRNNIETLILSAKTKSGKELSYVLNSMYREFHSLKGSSRFCKLKVFEMITHYIEDLLSDLQHKISGFDQATSDQLEECLLLGMDLLWELKIIIQESKSEKSIQYNKKWINKAHHLWLAVEKTRFNLRFSATS
jgi:hypothetical protein